MFIYNKKICRFWHSTAAYTIATEVGGGDENAIPPADHWGYLWPADLLAPDLVLCLVTSEEIRDQRLRNRGDVVTNEEAALKRDESFRRRLVEFFSCLDAST